MYVLQQTCTVPLMMYVAAWSSISGNGYNTDIININYSSWFLKKKTIWREVMVYELN